MYRQYDPLIDQMDFNGHLGKMLVAMLLPRHAAISAFNKCKLPSQLVGWEVQGAL